MTLTPELSKRLREACGGVIHLHAHTKNNTPLHRALCLAHEILEHANKPTLSINTLISLAGEFGAVVWCDPILLDSKVWWLPHYDKPEDIDKFPTPIENQEPDQLSAYASACCAVLESAISNEVKK